MLLFGARRALLTGPHPPGSSRLCRLRGFHHWFTRRYTVLPCLPDPGRLAVPTRPVVVRAAPTLPGASQAGLPSASAGLLRQPSGGSFHPTRSHSASWRTPLSAWTLPGRVRRRPAGVATWAGRRPCHKQHAIIDIGRSHRRYQRQPLAVHPPVQLGPRLATIDRICANLVPRVLARTLMVSRLARDQSTRPSTPTVDRDLHGCWAACRR
jgi:hypothetical protein